MTQPIRTALALTQDSLIAALAPLVPSYNSAPAVYWRQAPVGVAGALLSGSLASCIVVQSQDGGGVAVPVIGSEGWSGLVTVRCQSATFATALALITSIPEPLPLTADGYTIRADWQRPLDLPDVDGIATAAGIYRITITLS